MTTVAPPPSPPEPTPGIVAANPNAAVAGSVGAATILVVYVAQVAGLAVPDYVSSAFTTVVLAVVLYVGRLELSRKAKTP